MDFDMIFGLFMVALGAAYLLAWLGLKAAPKVTRVHHTFERNRQIRKRRAARTGGVSELEEIFRSQK